jgi:lysophospholipase L1-like esterase
MFPDTRLILTRLARTGAALTVLAACGAAHAETPAPALFVAPVVTPSAASTAVATAPSLVAQPAPPVNPDAAQPATETAAAAPSATPPLTCNTPVGFAHFERPLPRTAWRLASHAPLTIVAIGSSSTAGAGASSSAASYPSRLAVELRERFPTQPISVLNRGVNGEETRDMMARFDTGVIAEHPQLVLWQIGTNSVLRDQPLQPHSVLLREGIDELKAAGTDVVLIDPQYAPKVLAKPETRGMVEQIALTAKEENVDLFQRFAVMRNWYEVQHLPFDAFVSQDGLHMNDWSYACVAKLLAAEIAESATRPIASAAAHSER